MRLLPLWFCCPLCSEQWLLYSYSLALSTTFLIFFKLFLKYFYISIYMKKCRAKALHSDRRQSPSVTGRAFLFFLIFLKYKGFSCSGKTVEKNWWISVIRAVLFLPFKDDFGKFFHIHACKGKTNFHGHLFFSYLLCISHCMMFFGCSEVSFDSFFS